MSNSPLDADAVASGVGRWARYVAIGDSLSEGLWDHYADGSLRGWTDRLAQKLSARRLDAGLPALEYANLAIRGKKIRPILSDQLPEALRMGADLVSITAGGNDVLRPKVNVTELVNRLELAIVRAREAGADVLLVASADPKGSPLLELTRGRVAAFNCAIWSLARRHGCSVVDMWGLRGLKRWSAWSEDRLHMSPQGHELAAEAALVGLGLEPDDPSFDGPRTPSSSNPLSNPAAGVSGMGPGRRPSDRVWLRKHAIPWAQRHLKGRSSGDGRSAKRPDLEQIYP
ncbi:SGNH/GDSL hydrolase family protein [Gleimia hominis]|uniref:SGNH/GDSL hydrolase family protein n=1 Tax=Gleimia hominis TaxID=595468 RepID=UPI0018EB3AE9|nr:SGNH/GDSL hydrolase family protein [Gleimia hominis]WIK63845.1 SGNH/GDSL hydrolase family protein [Gleimia hominis]